MTKAALDISNLLEPLSGAVAEAGKLALSMFRTDLRAWNKENASPVTEADLAVDAFLRERLHMIDADTGWLSEETADAPARLERRRVWIVDPIDGTRSFMNGRDDWAICAALVEDGRPVLAAIAVPATGEQFEARANHGVTRNGSPISASRRNALADAVIARPALLNSALEEAGNRATAPHIHSIAVRFARVASGEIDAALASRNANDWDLAAADLLVHEAGGKLTDIRGRRPVYNLAVPKHGALIASGAELHPLLVSGLGGVLE